MTDFKLAENKDLYKEFLDYYKPRVSIRGFSVIKYLGHSVITWFDEKDLLMQHITIQDALDFRKSLFDKTGNEKLSIGSICNYIKMGRKIFRYLIKFDKVITNPFLDVKYPRIPDNISKNVLNEIQMNRLLDRISEFDTPNTMNEKLDKYRLHVLCVLLYATGIRIAEAANLLPEDINVKNRNLIIRNGKGGKSRIAYLTGYAADVLDSYMRRGRKRLLERGWRKHSERLFGADNETLAKTINKGLSLVCKKLKMPVITCHGFRHSLGTHLLRAGCDLRHIQLILGHDKLNSTQRYTRVDRRELRNIIDRYHPRKTAQLRACI